MLASVQPSISLQSPSCGLCGSPKHHGAVCQNCGLNLFDLAASSTTEEYPRLVEDFSVVRDCVVEPSQSRYAHYEICRLATDELWELGRGAMGITFKAVDAHLGCPVALKIINPRYTAGASAKERFLREARTAARLRHPNIASVFHLGLDDDECFYAMEYIEGETLDERVRRLGAMSCEDALNIMVQVGRALRAAHAENYIHRDIKPTNIMLVNAERSASGEPSVKVIDFGLVKAMTEGGVTENFSAQYFAGTPHYASPEQLERGAADARSDIYSLGRCLWFMLTGSVPPLSSALSELTAGNTGEAAAPETLPPNLPKIVVGLLRSMVESDPALRPQSAEELEHQVTTCLSQIHRQWQSRIIPISTLLTTLVVIVATVLKFASMPHGLPSNALATNAARSEAEALCAQGSDFVTRFTARDNQHAIELFSQVIARYPDFADAHAGLALAYFQQVARFGAPASQMDLASASAERATLLDPKAPRGFHALGAIRWFQRRPWEALAQLHHALELDPKFVPAMRDFSLYWSAVGKPEFALPWAKASTQLDPLNNFGWSVAADASTDLCADQQAEEYARRCIATDPMRISAHCSLINLHLLQGDFARARQDYVATEAIEHDSLLPLTLKAQIELFSGEYSAAQATYRQLLGMKRGGYVNYYNSITYLSALGFLCLKSGLETEGTALLDEAADLHKTESDGPQGIYDLAAIRSIQGRKEESLSLLEQAIASGWIDFRATRLDPRFEGLRTEKRFDQMLENLKGHVAQMKHEAEALCIKPISIDDYPVQPQAVEQKL